MWLIVDLEVAILDEVVIMEDVITRARYLEWFGIMCIQGDHASVLVKKDLHDQRKG